MQIKQTSVGGIPAMFWGAPSDRVYIHVHGKMSRKENAKQFAKIADEKGWQTLSFDLPEHGERHDGARCDVQNGMRELKIIADCAFNKWKRVSFFACSLGAHFALNTYAELPFEQCLLQSPVVDMEWLVRQMMNWFGVTEEQLRREGEIPTPIDTLRWDSYQYIRTHPLRQWRIPTAILYAGRDTMQSAAVMRAFSERFGCELCISGNSEHPFLAESDAPIVERWLREHIR